jgi:hypothetical protein
MVQMKHRLFESDFSPDDSSWLFHLMRDRGYFMEASGYDKTVWMNEKHEVLLAIGPLNDSRSSVFVKWLKYCLANKNNQFIPDIGAPETIVNSETGTKVLIAKSERLFEMGSISEHTGIALGFLSTEVDAFNNKKIEYLKAVTTYIEHPAALEIDNQSLFARKGKMFFTRTALEISSGLEYLILHMGQQQLVKLASTIFDVVQIGRKNGFQNDLHSSNFMIAEDGTIVINDPWVKYENI